ncbi:hypothetical protein ACFQH6_11905 [Halobacteriaceae archaeon GCM10025711]
MVTPAIGSLYRDDEVPDYFARDLFESSLTVLGELADVLDVPVLITDARDDAIGDLLVEHATHEIEVTKTSLGLRFETEDFETQLYWDEGFWQTTIPYWVELFGAVGETKPVDVARQFGLTDELEA